MFLVHEPVLEPLHHNIFFTIPRHTADWILQLEGDQRKNQDGRRRVLLVVICQWLVHLFCCMWFLSLEDHDPFSFCSVWAVNQRGLQLCLSLIIKVMKCIYTLQIFTRVFCFTEIHITAAPCASMQYYLSKTETRDITLLLPSLPRSLS